MSLTHSSAADRTLPTLREAAVFRFKSLGLQSKRAVSDFLGREAKRFPKRSELVEMPAIAESKSALWTEIAPEERFLVAGKIQNLRVAITALDGLEIPAGEVFSFWKQVGRTTKFKGYVEGRELREGCIIPNVGGGLCQLSNALYDAALKANFEIVERHAHTQTIAGSLAEQGRDATVFWNYVDLRFRSEHPFRIEAKLTSDHLLINFRGTKQERPKLHQIGRNIKIDHVNSCASCGMDDCFRSVKPEKNIDFGKTAFLVDEFSSEFDSYIQANRTDKDLLLSPLDGKRFKKANYAWTTSGFNSVRQSAFITAVRSFKSRRLASQGAARQKNLLATYEQLADSYAKKLSFDALHVVVQQNLLPHLWRKGHLGGRTFDVLMTALPMTELQKRLDHAFELHGESKTLGDFRADPDLVDAETEALKNARLIVATHSEIAALFPEKAELLEWKMPEVKAFEKQQKPKPQIVFPASTVGRKGCYELREAIRGLDVTLVTMGPNIEGADFWDGFDTTRGGDDWLASADLVVLPAFVEHKPLRLLRAAAAGIPVIASSACGVDNVAGVVTVNAGDAYALRQAIESELEKKIQVKNSVAV